MTVRAELDCIWCGKLYADFSTLAFHVQNRCGARRAAIKGDTQSQEVKQMRKTATSDGMPTPSAGNGDADFPQFLRSSDIGKKIGAKGKVIFLGKPGRKVQSSFGEQWAFPVKVGKKTYDFAIKVNSGNHRRIADRFGSKAPKGAVAVEIKEFNRNLYIAIV